MSKEALVEPLRSRVKRPNSYFPGRCENKTRRQNEAYAQIPKIGYAQGRGTCAAADLCRRPLIQVERARKTQCHMLKMRQGLHKEQG